jgi:hypothetical protein
MDYELAKQLKEAGFQQNIKASDAYFMEDGRNNGNKIKIPTLEELIEASVHPVELLRLTEISKGKWGASRTDEEYYHGATPEEAVARLYLALNKKDAQ